MTVPSPKSNVYEARGPSGSEEAEASAVTGRGEPPEGGVTLRAAVGNRLVLATLIAVVADPEGPLDAVKVTLYGVARLSLNVGVQVSVPAVCDVLVKTALF